MGAVFFERIWKQILLNVILLAFTTAVALADDVPYPAVRFRELVIMDPKVFYHEKILDKLPQNARVVFLNGDTGGLDAVTRILAREKDIRILRVFSHGAPGQIFLNGEVIDRKALAARRAEVLGWAEALADDADILLYGCDVARKEEGEAFINELALLTGADVAASTNPTGGLENEWALEYASGTIEASDMNVPGYLYYLENQVVTSNADDGGGALITLREAIAAVGEGEEITFNLSSPSETITLASELEITKSLTINGDNTTGSGTDVTISGNNACRVFNIDAPGKTIDLSNLTITGGNAYAGGGIFITSFDESLVTCTISGCTVTGNTANYNGGINAKYSVVTIQNSSITNNTADGSGGIANYGTMTIEASTISGNTAEEYGGGIFNYGTLTLKNSTVADNSCTGTSFGSSNGGGIFNQNGTLNLINTTISRNSVNGYYGAGLYSWDAVTARNTIIAGNTDNDTKFDYYGMGTLTDNGYNVVEYQGFDAPWSTSIAFDATISILYNYDYEGNLKSEWNKNKNSVSGSLNLSDTLANNGGPTKTLALAEESFAIDEIPLADNQCGSCDPLDPDCPYAVDQRGITRPYNQPSLGGCDIGAYERTSQTLVELESFTAEGRSRTGSL